MIERKKHVSGGNEDVSYEKEGKDRKIKRFTLANFH